MTKITNSPLLYYTIGDSPKFEVRDPLDFYKSVFSLPVSQPFPIDRFEITTFCVIGDRHSGRTHSIKYFAFLCSEIWKEYIDFLECEDAHSTFESIKISLNPVHFIFIKDDKEITASQKYFALYQMIYRENQKIENTLDKRYGYFIIALKTHNLASIDRRLAL